MSKSCSRKYQRTPLNYNSCVYDLYAEYEDIPSNIPKPSGEDVSKMLQDTMPLGKKIFFQYQSEELTPENVFNLKTGYSIGYLSLFETIDKSNIKQISDNVSINGDNIISNNSSDCIIQTPPIPILGNNPIIYATTTGKNLSIEVFNTNNNVSLKKTSNLDDIENYSNSTNNIYAVINIPSTGYFTKIDLYTKIIIHEG